MPEAKELCPSAVICRGVVKAFGIGAGRTTALRGVDLDVLPGELTALVGPSGCGKTTLVSIIAGILSADAGRIEVFGTSLGTLTRRKLAAYRAANIGFALQQFNLLPSLTVLENVTVPLLARGVPSWRANAKATALITEFELGAHLAKFPAALSMGQQQRVTIARALVHDPKLIICDEPTAALDAASGRLAIEMLRRAVLRPDRAVIVVTHDPRVLPLADRIAAMSDGRIAGNEAAVGREAA